ncbi:peptidase M24, structural domain-containing protein [Corynascus novoguineensis]|uniref:Xaa-Pro aminopeptidase n=1 Tax=Corynascus novoguineensis TaxID=1126955 RepID=A0AAN7HGX2_9PEZI|nr:peptidase M24, structural domain-containing protein [Corynascus novoguineensis]
MGSRFLRPVLRQIRRPFIVPTNSLSLRLGHRSFATSISAAELEFGQPVYETHPHILKPGEITPGITAQEYADRRAKLAHSLPDGAVAVLPSAEVKYRSGAVFYPFRQESNFLYLTGFSEPQSLAVIRKTGPSLGDYTFHLFCRPKDAFAEQWSGPWSGLRAAEDVFNADEAGDINAVATLLPPLLRSASRIYTDVTPSSSSSSSSSSSPLPSVLSSLPTAPSTAPLTPLVNAHRAIKSPSEISVMRHAGRVSGRAFTSAMRRPWASESDLRAYLAHAFSGDGLSGEAYVPVVAGGTRGRMIHYTHNTALLRDGETVLVDAGGEYGWYITDITRVWPIGGRFTAAQRDLYAAVLRVQRMAVGLCTERSGLSLDEVHRATEAALQKELEQLGFEFGRGMRMLPGGGGDLMGILFPHHVGHYVGLDVHDVPGYPRSTPLRAGHCVTIEPGVYVPDDDRFPKHFRGLAVRIEDSVCVDEDAPLVLTPEAVKEVEDIEALR